MHNRELFQQGHDVSSCKPGKARRKLSYVGSCATQKSRKTGNCLLPGRKAIVDDAAMYVGYISRASVELNERTAVVRQPLPS